MALNHVNIVSTHAKELLNDDNDMGWQDESFLSKIDELCGGQTLSSPLIHDVEFKSGERTNLLIGAPSPPFRLNLRTKETLYYPEESLEKSTPTHTGQSLDDGFIQRQEGPFKISATTAKGKPTPVTKLKLGKTFNIKQGFYPFTDS
jgi:hypothetical protein